MTKDELCKAAGVSPRTIDRAVKSGILPKPSYEKIKGNSVAIFPDEVAQRYIEHANGIVSAVGLAVSKKADVEQVTALADSFLDKLGDKIVYSLVAAHFETAKLNEHNGSKTPVVELKDQLMLSASQAAKLSGIPRRRLIAAYKDGILPGFYNDARVGRGYRFNRFDLQGYTVRLSGTEQHEK